MRHLLLSLLLLGFLNSSALGQDIRYISDQIFVGLHTGPGNDYRWRLKLTPGSKLSVLKRSSNGKWVQVRTSGGTEGWVSTEHLTAEVPAQLRLPEAQKRAEQLTASNSELKRQLSEIQADKSSLQKQESQVQSELQAVSKELAELKQVSGRAVQLDTDNRRLVEDSENLRSEVEMLEAENQRLQDKLKSEDFFNGALAVLLGVVITLVVPRIWPKRRKSSGWA